MTRYSQELDLFRDQFENLDDFTDSKIIVALSKREVEVRRFSFAGRIKYGTVFTDIAAHFNFPLIFATYLDSQEWEGFIQVMSKYLLSVAGSELAFILTKCTDLTADDLNSLEVMDICTLVLGFMRAQLSDEAVMAVKKEMAEMMGRLADIQKMLLEEKEQMNNLSPPPSQNSPPNSTDITDTPDLIGQENSL